MKWLSLITVAVAVYAAVVAVAAHHRITALQKAVSQDIDRLDGAMREERGPPLFPPEDDDDLDG